MGNVHQQSGTLTITIRQRNAQPREWLLGVVVQPNPGISSAKVEMHSPFGAGSESDLGISDLTVAIAHSAVDIYQYCLMVRFVLGGHTVLAELLAVGKPSQYPRDDMWAGVVPGPDGQPQVVTVQLNTGRLQMPFGDVVQSSGAPMRTNA